MSFLKLDKEDMVALAKMIADELRANPEEPKWLETHEHAAAIGKSAQTVRKWYRDGLYSTEDYKYERGRYLIKEGAKRIK